MNSLDLDYVLPLRWADEAGLDELTAYLHWLSRNARVIVVDGSPDELFARHARRWRGDASPPAPPGGPQPYLIWFGPFTSLPEGMGGPKQGGGQHPMPSLDMRHQHHTGVTVITLAGELDLSCCDRLNDYIAEVRQSPSDHLVFDMGEVTFVDSHGLQAVLDAYTHAREHGGTVHLTALRGLPARLVEVTGVGDHVRLHSSTEAALAAISVMPDLPPPAAGQRLPADRVPGRPTRVR